MRKESVACIISSGSKVLLAKRLAGENLGCLWEFPGGKVEAGETHEQAIRREILEEFGVSASVGKFLAQDVFEHDGKSFTLFAYEVFLSADISELRLTDHSEVQWMDLDKIPSLDFVESDMKIYPAVKRRILGNQHE